MSFPESKLWDLINDGRDRMSLEQRRLWDAICAPPQEWEMARYGPFWVVALIGSYVIYYNHLEDGFARSQWNRLGVIDRYDSAQSELEDEVQRQITRIAIGYDPGPHSGPPIAGEY